MKIFVSSTIKDLVYLRDELYRYLKDLGHTPWFSEKEDFPSNYHPDAMTNCLKVAEECDLFVVLLDKRAGLPYSKRDGSPYPELFGLTISEAEYRCAQKKGKPICIFISKRAENECALYRQIIDKDQRKKLKLYSDPGIYEFYDRMMHEKPHVPWRYTFDSINEIMEPLNAIIGEVQYPPQNGKYVKFTCTSREAEHAKEVYVAGEFNNWLMPKGSLIRPSPKDQEMYGLQRQIWEGKEIWEKDILVSPGHYDFKFVVGRRHWIHWYEESGYPRGNDAPGGPNFRIEVSDAELKPERPKKSLKPKKSFKYDVFICHASEDKESFVRALAVKLQNKGLKVWFDEFTLTIGDSLRRSIDNGLVDSRYGVVVLSKKFFEKEWPQKELDGLVAREEGSNKVILPIWHGITQQEVRFFSPILADLIAVSSDKGIDHVVNEIVKAKNSA